MGRMEKVNQQVKREISGIIQKELGDPRLGFVSVTQVHVSKDLRNAKIHFSVLGDQKQIDAAQSGLDGARGLIRHYLGKNLNMRNTPELFFIYDKSIEHSVHIEETIKEIHHESDEDHQHD